MHTVLIFMTRPAASVHAFLLLLQASTLGILMLPENVIFPPLMFGQSLGESLAPQALLSTCQLVAVSKLLFLFLQHNAFGQVSVTRG